jgi:hypothetical protein
MQAVHYEQMKLQMKLVTIDTSLARPGMTLRWVMLLQLVL